MLFKPTHAIEAFIEEHVGINSQTGEMGKMYFDRTLEDWIGYKIDNRTKYDLTISSGLALLGAQRVKVEKRKVLSMIRSFSVDITRK